MTPWERKLWYEFLRSYPVRFQRQKAIGNYIADFYCAKARLVVELDGGGHYTPEQIEKDKVKEIRNLTLEELKNKYQSESDDDYINIRNLIGKDCIFEFGKLYWDDTVERK